MFRIGNLNIKNKVILAPMAGISNPAYMKIVAEMGCGCAITELISSEAVIRKNKKTLDMLNGIDDIDMPVGVQLFGSNPDVIAGAAKIITDRFNIDFIDINMGCPVPKVAVRAHAGSALLKDPDKAYEIVKKVKETIDIPVTVKIRSGWDFNSINATLVAKKLEEAGASMITVHGRTRSQGYTGKADWNIIKEVKESVNIPVTGNGDIRTCYDAKKMIDETGCDAVMIARGCLGNPWLIKETIDYLENGIEPKKVTREEKFDMILKHIDLLEELKNEKIANLEMRSHIGYYLKGVDNVSELKDQVFKMKTLEDLRNLIKEYKEV